MQGLGRNAAGNEPRERLLDRSLLRPAVRIALVGASPPHPMVLFRDVGKVEEVREAARDRHGGFGGHRLQFARERLELILSARAVPGSLRECAHALHPFEERHALLPPQCFAEQAAEQAHVVAQRLVGVFAHKLIILRQMTGSRTRSFRARAPEP